MNSPGSSGTAGAEAAKQPDREKLSEGEIRRSADSIPWFHSIDLGHGIVTAGSKSAEQLEHEWRAFRIPDVRGKTVLDIGAWDGYFSFAAERAGARRVVALDHFVWSMDLAAHDRYCAECSRTGEVPRRYEDMEYWKPEELPGKRGFDLARRALGSRVEARVADFMTMDLDSLGRFDVVLFLGVLYHLQEPFLGLKRLASVTQGVAVIETQATAFPGYEDQRFVEFYPSNELHGDVSNWWAPNERALVGMCSAAGFEATEVIAGSPSRPGRPFAGPERPLRYRAVVHARKDL